MNQHDDDKPHKHRFVWSGDFWACDCGTYADAEQVEILERRFAELTDAGTNHQEYGQ